MAVRSEMPCQRIYQSAAEVPVPRMHDKPGRLVYNKEIVVFIYDVQWYVLGTYFVFPPLIRHHEGYDISGLYYVIGFYDFTVYLYVLFFYGELYTVSGRVFQMRGKILVHSHERLAFVGSQAEVLEHFLPVLGIGHFFIQFLVCFRIEYSVKHILQVFLGCFRYDAVMD